jgi:hypothetical protein
MTTSDVIWKTAGGVDPSQDIFLDCACTRHVVNRRDLFVKYLPLKKGVCRVQGFDGSTAYAQGVGSIRLPMRIPGGINWITFRNVLHVAESANLISQGRLMRLGVHFEVNGYGTNIYDPKTGMLMACAPLVALMQPFDIAWEALGSDSESRSGSRETAPAAPPASLVEAFKATARVKGETESELQLWHRRFAHLGLEAVRRLPAAVQGVSSAKTSTVGGAHREKKMRAARRAALAPRGPR